MKSLLSITASLFDSATAQGVSTQLNEHLVGELLNADPGLQLRTRDLAKQPIPHLDGAWLNALSLSAERRTPAQQEMADYSDRLIAELDAAEMTEAGRTAPLHPGAAAGIEDVGLTQ